MKFEHALWLIERLRGATFEKQLRIINSMTPADLVELDAWFEIWAHKSQLPPIGDGWRVWLMMAGRARGLRADLRKRRADVGPVPGYAPRICGRFQRRAQLHACARKLGRGRRAVTSANPHRGEASLGEEPSSTSKRER